MLYSPGSQRCNSLKQLLSVCCRNSYNMSCLFLDAWYRNTNEGNYKSCFRHKHLFIVEFDAGATGKYLKKKLRDGNCYSYSLS